MEIIKSIATIIKEQHGRAFYVGGYVRDKLLGITNEDIDIEVFGIDLAVLETILSRFGTVLTVGKAFGILKLAEYPHLDFAMPRTEVSTGNAHQDFDISLDVTLSYIEAAKRRDFTINALMEDVLTGEILDFFGGQRDIKRQVIRFVAKDSFIEDSLRGLRAAQFASRFNFSIDLATRKLIQSFSYRELSDERIQQEMNKGLFSKNSAYFLEMLAILDILEKILPGLYIIRWQQTKNYQQLLNYLKKLDANPNLSQEQLYYYTLLILFVLDNEDEMAILEHFATTKRKRHLVLHLKKEILQTRNINLALDVRAFKVWMENYQHYSTFLQFLCEEDNSFLPPQFIDFTTFKDFFQQSIRNNPGPNPLIQGRDLIRLGFTPGTSFKEILDFALELEIEGLEENEIIEQILLRYKP